MYIEQLIYAPINTNSPACKRTDFPRLATHFALDGHHRYWYRAIVENQHHFRRYRESRQASGWSLCCFGNNDVGIWCYSILSSAELAFDFILSSFAVPGFDPSDHALHFDYDDANTHICT